MDTINLEQFTPSEVMAYLEAGRVIVYPAAGDCQVCLEAGYHSENHALLAAEEPRVVGILCMWCGRGGRIIHGPVVELSRVTKVSWPIAAHRPRGKVHDLTAAQTAGSQAPEEALQSWMDDALAEQRVHMGWLLRRQTRQMWFGIAVALGAVVLVSAFNAFILIRLFR